MENAGANSLNPSVKKSLDYIYPHGHRDFNGMCIDEMALHSRKNHDYARGGDPLGNFNRVARFLDQYPGLDLGDPTIVALVYALKQVDAALWMLAGGYEGQVEGIAARLGDVSVYAKLAIILNKQEQEVCNALNTGPQSVIGEPLPPVPEVVNTFDPEVYLNGRSYGETPLHGGM